MREYQNEQEVYEYFREDYKRVMADIANEAMKSVSKDYYDPHDDDHLIGNDGGDYEDYHQHDIDDEDCDTN